MIDYASAKAACETYVRCLEESELETLLDLFADDATDVFPLVTTTCAATFHPQGGDSFPDVLFASFREVLMGTG